MFVEQNVTKTKDSQTSEYSAFISLDPVGC